MDQCYALIENDWTLDRIRWKDEEPFRSGRTGLKTDSYDLTTIAGNQAYIRDYIHNRYQFLNEYWQNPDSFCTLTFTDDTIGEIAVYCKRNAALTDSMLPDGLLAISLDGFLGWYTEDGVSVADVDIVTEDMTFQGAWDVVEAAPETVSNNQDVSEKADDENLLIVFLKKIYHGFGLDSFGIGRLAVCGLFGILLLGMLCVEILRWIRQRRGRQ